MIFNIYVIGVVLCLLWFMLFAIVTFERSVYERSHEEAKKAIDHMHETLESINPESPQTAYFIVSIFITVTWPITIPYLYFKIKYK